MTSEQDVIRNILRVLHKAKTLAPADAATYLRPLVSVFDGYGPHVPCAADASSSVKALIAALSTGEHASSEMWDNAVRGVGLWDEQIGREA